MINKKILGLAGLASLGLATAPLTAVHADTSTSLESNAAVTFQQDTSAKSPLDPTTPANDDNTQNPVSPIDTVTGTTPNAGTEGLLTIDFASSFNFGSQIISSATKTYSALPQSYTQKDSSKVSDTTGPNFVQVTDVRNGGAKGWSLTVKQNDDFKTASGVALEGAEIKISNGNVLNGEILRIRLVRLVIMLVI
ncbi:WxL domain-containing protein [Leuconostoc mesenteroides]|uniref:WxL domain-containing protein n=1 Tax=Leuconostoc mesenteroides TaxID=1245 RepID=UPI00311F4313